MIQASELQKSCRQRSLLPALGLAALALVGFWPTLNSHPLMDDHLFFSWLEKTPWRDAIWQRLTGNWILNFPQMQMYRPISGLWQVAMYQLFGANPLPHHLLNLSLHLGTSLLAGLLAYNLTEDRKTGWLVTALLLVHPRAALGVSLIYNFHDPLVALLMMSSLVCLFAVRRNGGIRRIFFHLTVIWLGVGLALGSKELALPLVGVLLLADLFWESDKQGMSRVIACHIGPVVLLITYVLAREHFIGHPFQTHHPQVSFPLPANSYLWAFLWDGLLLGCCFAGALAIKRWQRLRQLLPRESAWMLLWCGCLLLPAVHFCSQVTLRPWFFDERYWYVPLVPLTVFTGLLLTHGSTLSSALGAAILALTLPGTVGLFLATMIFLATAVIFRAGRYQEELQRTVATLFLAAMTMLLWKQCWGIRLRGDDAQSLHSQFREIISQTPPGTPIGLIDFTESAVEQKQPFNGDLQWLLQPPFFEENIADRFFFAYPTWDSPPTNRFWDRTTPQLLERISRGQAVKVYRWNEETRKLKPVGLDIKSHMNPPPPSLEFQPVPMRPASINGVTTAASEDGTVCWVSGDIFQDPKVYYYVSLSLSALKPSEISLPLVIKLAWISKRSDHWKENKEIQVGLDKENHPQLDAPSKAELWLFPGRRVDWLLGESILGLRVTANQNIELTRVQLATALPPALSKAHHLNHYAYPPMRFQWIGESWWKLDD